MIRKVGVLTGGGDVPGLNALIKSLVERLEEEGREVVGLRRGWASLVNMRPGDADGNAPWLMPLDRRSTRRIDRTGGTVLHSSRLNPAILLPNQLPEHLELEEGAESLDATGHVLDPVSLNLDGRPLQVVALATGQPAVRFDGARSGTLSYRSRPGAHLQTVGEGSWPDLPPEVADLVKTFSVTGRSMPAT